MSRHRVVLGQMLTEREREILVGVARGRTNAEIGQDLFIALETVRSHVSNIFVKLGAVSRAHAVTKGFAGGYLTLASDGAGGAGHG